MIIGNQLIVPEIQSRNQKTGTILNWIFYGVWKSSFINIPTVKTLLDFTAMFGNYNLHRRNFKFLPAFIVLNLSLIHISEPTRLLSISYAVFCLKKKKKKNQK